MNKELTEHTGGLHLHPKDPYKIQILPCASETQGFGDTRDRNRKFLGSAGHPV